MGVTEQRQFAQVPTATGETTLTLTPIGNDPAQLQIEPWRFQVNSVELLFEGRLLQEPAANDQEMQQQLVNAQWLTLTATIRPIR